MAQRDQTVRKSALELHRTECWIRASESTVLALLQIMRVIDEQQGLDWRRPRRRIRRAFRHFRRAEYWVRAGLKNPMKGDASKLKGGIQ